MSSLSKYIFLLDILRLQTKLYILTATRKKIHMSPFALTYKHITLTNENSVEPSLQFYHSPQKYIHLCMMQINLSREKYVNILKHKSTNIQD